MMMMMMRRMEKKNELIVDSWYWWSLKFHMCKHYRWNVEWETTTTDDDDHLKSNTSLQLNSSHRFKKRILMYLVSREWVRKKFIAFWRLKSYCCYLVFNFILLLFFVVVEISFDNRIDLLWTNYFLPFLLNFIRSHILCGVK